MSFSRTPSNEPDVLSEWDAHVHLHRQRATLLNKELRATKLDITTKQDEIAKESSSEAGNLRDAEELTSTVEGLVEETTLANDEVAFQDGFQSSLAKKVDSIIGKVSIRDGSFDTERLRKILKKEKEAILKDRKAMREKELKTIELKVRPHQHYTGIGD